MNDAEDIYAEGPGVRYVVRLSRTATGTRTYTVGASIPEEDGSRDGARISRLFAIEEVVRLLIDNDNQLPGAEDATAPTVGKRAHDLLALNAVNGEGWYTTAQMVERLGASRQYVVALLTKMRKAGQIEYERGGGHGRPSRYRLVTQARPRIVK